MNPIDSNLILWLNGLSGNVKLFDDLMRIIATDYLMPLAFSLAMLALWFSGRNPAERLSYQMAAVMGASAIGLSNVAVWLVNIMWDRPRPFVPHGDELDLLFYPPTDPSFPANPVAVGFAAATAVWSVNRTFGWWLYGASIVYGFSRVYAGVFFPSDIVGGAVVGIAVFGFTTYLRRFLEPVITTFVRVIRGLSAA